MLNKDMDYEHSKAFVLSSSVTLEFSLERQVTTK